MTKAITYLLFIILLSHAGCNLFEKRNPCKEKMDKEKFTEILTDIFLIESYFESIHIRRDGLDDSIAFYYNTLFYKHQTTKEEVIQAMDCYVLEKELIDKIHDKIMNKISILETE